MTPPLSPSAVKGNAAVLPRGTAGPRLHPGGWAVTGPPARFLRRHVEEVGLDAADKSFRKHGFTLVTTENNR